MPNVNYGEIPDADTREPIPEGKYLCEVEVVEETTTQSGDEMWNITLKVIGGKYDGRYVWDRVVFKEGKAMSRMKLVTTRLGIAKDFKGMLKPEMLKGRRAKVTVEIEEYDGKEKNKVTFDGYEKINGTSDDVYDGIDPSPPSLADDIPF